MFKSLSDVKINWGAFIGIGIILLLFNLSVYCYFALLLSIYQCFLFFFSINHFIPVRYLFGSLMCLQMFVGPALAYSGLDQYQYMIYRMQVTESEYFGYAFPAVILFILGLHLNCKELEGERINEEAIKKYADENTKLAYIFVVLGFFSSFIKNFLPGDLAFVMYLVSGFKFIGVFLLIMGTKKVKTVPLFLVYGSVISSSLGEAMFHDLLMWVIFLGCIYAIKFKPKVVIKTAFLAGFVLLATTIQLLKNNYRSTIQSGENAGLETFTETLEEKKQENNDFFSFANLAPNNVRINQGFIVTNIMKTVPDREPFSEGAEMRQIFEAAVLPRFLAPNKLKAGDKTIFTKYSGITLRDNTSMGLSSLGDAYLNFGVWGGSIFMFFLGLLYNQTLRAFHKYSKNFPILILFVSLVFYYPIRPDCELQTILGHLIKSCFLIWVVISVWRHLFFFAPKKAPVLAV